jgi:DNA-binding MarR family transcriptional regulator
MVSTNPNLKHTAVRLRVALSALMRQLRSTAPADGIGSARLSALGALYLRGPMTPTELAAHERVKLQTLTRLLAELEADAWLVREPDPDDGRRTVLSLTRLGIRQLTADVQRREASLAAAIEAALTPAQQANLLKACEALDALTAALGGAAEPIDAAARARR